MIEMISSVVCERTTVLADLQLGVLTYARFDITFLSDAAGHGDDYVPVVLPEKNRCALILCETGF